MVTSIPGELTFENSTINSAILYYENLTGNVSALLQRTTSHYYPSIHGKSAPETWIDITSQDSKSLPSEFRNTPGRNSSNDSYSYTLYESDINATYSTPFTSGANFSGWSVGALFYSSSNATQLGGPLVSGGSIVFTGYMVGPNGTGNFNTGMHRESSFSE